MTGPGRSVQLRCFETERQSVVWAVPYLSNVQVRNCQRILLDELTARLYVIAH